MAVLLPALSIFALRILDVATGSLRLLMVMRGRKLLAWIFGFVQAVVFVLAIRQVLTGLGAWQNLVAYAAGFATGTVVGIWLEEKIAIGYGHMRIISPQHGAALAQRLREAGYAVTLVAGRGMEGTVDILNLSVPRRETRRVKALAMAVDPKAFITVEDVRPLWRGFWKKGRRIKAEG